MTSPDRLTTSRAERRKGEIYKIRRRRKKNKKEGHTFYEKHIYKALSHLETKTRTPLTPTNKTIPVIRRPADAIYNSLHQSLRDNLCDSLRTDYTTGYTTVSATVYATVHAQSTHSPRHSPRTVHATVHAHYLQHLLLCRCRSSHPLYKKRNCFKSRASEQML